MFRQLVSPADAPRACAGLCTLRVLEHHLAEEAPAFASGRRRSSAGGAAAATGAGGAIVGGAAAGAAASTQQQPQQPGRSFRERFADTVKSTVGTVLNGAMGFSEEDESAAQPDAVLTKAAGARIACCMFWLLTSFHLNSFLCPDHQHF